MRRLRVEGRSWDEVARYLNARRVEGRPGGGAAWTPERLVRAVRRFVAEGLAEVYLLVPSTREAAPDRLLAVVAGIVCSNLGATLRHIGERLEATCEPP